MEELNEKGTEDGQRMFVLLRESGANETPLPSDVLLENPIKSSSIFDDHFMNSTINPQSPSRLGAPVRVKSSTTSRLLSFLFFRQTASPSRKPPYAHKTEQRTSSVATTTHDHLREFYATRVL